ncbi:MAG: signal peptide peptidase SppA [Nanoarchaeota archaeon]|nr:signal peptide peptidase SppA [Nanoarchaeota archaeon]
MAQRNKNKDMKRKITPNFIFITIISVFLLVLLIFAIKSSFTNKLMVISIDGTITSSDTGFLFFIQEANVPGILSCLEKAEKDSTVKAVLLDINSPGGEVVGSYNIERKVLEVKQKKPVVAFISEVGASGGYWIASAADKIVAEPYSITGSIGVIASYLEYAGLLQDWNLTYQRLVTGEYKDIADPARELTDNERNILLAKLNIIHKDFLDTVAENRNLDDAQKYEVGKSLFYLGKEAKDLGLVDELGDRKKAESIATELANKDKLFVVTCEKKDSLFSFYKASANFAYFFGKGFGNELKTSSSGIELIPSV